MRVGGINQYIKITPRGDGVDTYDIDFVVGNFSVSSSGTKIAGDKFEVYSKEGQLLFDISDNGSRILVDKGEFVTNTPKLYYIADHWNSYCYCTKFVYKDSFYSCDAITNSEGKLDFKLLGKNFKNEISSIDLLNGFDMDVDMPFFMYKTTLDGNILKVLLLTVQDTSKTSG